MNPSLFIALVQTYFPKLITSIVEKYNDKNSLLPYYYRKYLKKVFSVDGKWGSVSVNNALVAADIIAMDSAIPLKKRASLGQYTGDIPKMGLEFTLNEKELTDLQTLLIRLNYNGSATQAQIVAKLFRDVDACIGGIYERIEAMFLQGLSNGVTVVSDYETVGTGIRLDYRYKTENAFESTVSWDDTATATPLTDLARVLAAARVAGTMPTLMLLDFATVNYMAASNEGRQLYASVSGFAGDNIPTPTEEQLRTAIRQKYRLEIDVIDRAVRFQRDGVDVSFTPWKAGRVVLLPSAAVGSLAWTRLAEQDHPVAGVEYQTADDFILVSKFNENRPSLREVTNGQARVVPVIDNAQSIFTLDTTQDNP